MKKKTQNVFEPMWRLSKTINIRDN